MYKYIFEDKADVININKHNQKRAYSESQTQKKTLSKQLPNRLGHMFIYLLFCNNCDFQPNKHNNIYKNKVKYYFVILSSLNLSLAA